MKKTVFILILLVLCVVTGAAFADGTCGPNLTWTLSDTGVLTVSGAGPMDDYTSSSSVPWKEVKDNIISVVVEDGVTRIGDNAFYYCKNLITVTLPDSVTSIGKYAFQSSSKITSINLTDNITAIGRSAFDNCDGLTSIHIPSGLEKLEYGTFSGCDNLTAPVLPEGLKSIDDSVFYGCKSITEIVIPASVTSIGTDRTFVNCGKLSSITVADGNPGYTDVEGVLFNKDMTSLLYYPVGKTGTAYSVPEGTVSVNDYAFAYSNLMDITVPGSIRAIGKYAFYHCGKLMDVNFFEGLESIGSYAFTGNSALTKISFPASLNTLGEDMFESCSNLTEFTVAEGSAFFTSFEGVLFNANRSVLIAYPAGKIGVSYTVPEGVEKIGDYAFYGNKKISGVTFPETLVTIGKSSFQYCDALNGIELPQSLRSLDARAFNDCDGLTGIVLPANLTLIGDGAFNWCSNLTSATVLNPDTGFDRWGVFNYCSDDLVISGYAGSTAEAYAAEHEIAFSEIIPEEPEPEVETIAVSEPEKEPEPEAEPHSHEGEDEVWVCGSCGNEMHGGNFCSECGAARPHPQVCGNCGYQVPDGMVMNFCPVCGTKLEVPAADSGLDLQSMTTEELTSLLISVQSELASRGANLK